MLLLFMILAITVGPSSQIWQFFSISSGLIGSSLGRMNFSLLWSFILTVIVKAYLADYVV